MGEVSEGKMQYIIKNLIATGDDGDGYVALISQNSTPTSEPDITKIYNNDDNFAWVTSEDVSITLDTSAVTSDRVFTWPDVNGEVITNNSTATLTNKNIIASPGTTITATHIGDNVLIENGSPALGDMLIYDGTQWSHSQFNTSPELSYNYNTGLIVNTGATAGTLVSGNDGRLSTANTIFVKNSNAGAGEFTSIGAAISSIVGAAANNVYKIIIGPGIYVESPMTVPPYVFIEGSNPSVTTIIHATPNSVLFTLSSNTSLRNVTLVGNGVGDTGVSINSCVNAILSNSGYFNFNRSIYVRASTSPVNVLILNVGIRGSFVEGVYVDGTIINSAFEISVTMSTCTIVGTASATVGVVCIGPFASITTSVLTILSVSNGDGVLVQDGGSIGLYGSQISGCNYGLAVRNVGDDPNVSTSAAGFFNSISYGIFIEHPGCSGVINGVSRISKLYIEPTSTISVTLTDPEVNSVAFRGDMLHLSNDASKSTELTDTIIFNSPIGLLTGGDVYDGGGLNINVTALVGYIAEGTYPSGILNKISFDAATIALAPNQTHYIYANINGVTSANSPPDFLSAILLARVRTSGVGLEFIDLQQVNSTYHYNYDVHMNKKLFGVLFVKGGIVTANASRELSISSANYYYGGNEYTTIGQSFPATWVSYYHSGGIFTTAAQSIVNNSQYDNGNDLVAIPAMMFAKHSFYTVGDGVNEKYFLVYGQEIFLTLDAAIEGNIAIPPNYFSEGVVLVANIIVQQGLSSIPTIIDMRPFAGGVRNGVSTVAPTDHGDLTGLVDDDHPQYILVNGSREFTGSVNIGGNAIINAGLINGVTITSHASRHLPNGADSLMTEAPVIPISANTINFEGVANSFARSDHNHELDLSGFNLGDFGGILDVDNGGTGHTTLTASRVLIGAGMSPIDLSKPAPIGNFVGDNDAQTLSNKIISSVTNTVDAVALQTVNINSTLPNTSQVLVAINPTNASWSYITDSSIEGQISVTHGGTGVTSLTSGHFLIGDGENAVDLSKLAPTGSVVGTTDTQILTNKTASSATNNLDARSLYGTAIHPAPPQSAQFLRADNFATASWSSLNASDITGVISVENGGTGHNSLTAGNFLIGNGSDAINTTKPAPIGSIVGTSDSQTLTNKILMASTNTIGAAFLQNTAISTNPPSNGDYLYYNGTVWVPQQITSGTQISQTWVLRETKISGTPGGSITENIWTKRVLNELRGNGPGLSLFNGQITFAPGTYKLYGETPMYQCGVFKIRLFNITTNSVVTYGGGSLAQTSNQQSSQIVQMLVDIVTFNTITVCEFQVICSSTRLTDGLGVATGNGTEIYATLAIDKLN